MMFMNNQPSVTRSSVIEVDFGLTLCKFEVLKKTNKQTNKHLLYLIPGHGVSQVHDVSQVYDAC